MLCKTKYRVDEVYIFYKQQKSAQADFSKEVYWLIGDSLGERQAVWLVDSSAQEYNEGPTTLLPLYSVIHNGDLILRSAPLGAIG